MKTHWMVLLAALFVAAGCATDTLEGTGVGDPVEDASQDTTEPDTQPEDVQPQEDVQSPPEDTGPEDTPRVDVADEVSEDVEAPIDAEAQDATPEEDVVEVEDTTPDVSNTPDVGEDPDGGPALLMSCADLSDQAILDVVYEGPKVPAGFYLEPTEVSASPQWRQPCSDSLTESRRDAAALFDQGELTGDERTTDFFFEVDVAINNGQHTIHYRRTRCDYFDGQILAGAPHNGPDALVSLVGYLWYTINHNFSGSNLLGAVAHIGNFTHRVELCHVTTVFGDFGLCDDITVRQTNYTLTVDGTVTRLGQDTILRNLEGRCN